MNASCETVKIPDDRRLDRTGVDRPNLREIEFRMEEVLNCLFHQCIKVIHIKFRRRAAVSIFQSPKVLASNLEGFVPAKGLLLTTNQSSDGGKSAMRSTRAKVFSLREKVSGILLEPQNELSLICDLFLRGRFLPKIGSQVPTHELD